MTQTEEYSDGLGKLRRDEGRLRAASRRNGAALRLGRGRVALARENLIVKRRKIEALDETPHESRAMVHHLLGYWGFLGCVESSNPTLPENRQWRPQAARSLRRYGERASRAACSTELHHPPGHDRSYGALSRRR